MAARKTRTKRAPSAARKPAESAGVDEFLAGLDHPLKPGIEAIRRVILKASPTISEEIKWNSPSFRTADDFATVNLRAKDGTERLWIILHTGARPRKGIVLDVPDPAKLLTWLGTNRALVKFADAKDVKSKQAALTAIIKAWIACL